jgi:hypothetical protein
VPFGLALLELLLSRDFFRPTFLKALLFERLFIYFRAFRVFSSGFLAMTVRTDSYFLFGTVWVIQGEIFPLKLSVTGQQSLQAFLD